MLARVLALFVGFGLGGCGDDGGATPDGSLADGGVADAERPRGMPLEPEPPVAPAEAALPSLLPCPSGWREVMDGEVPVCDPWPATGVADCAAPDEAHFPGEPGCRRVGEPAGADGWPTGIPAGTRTIYVSAAAAPGGDGSTASPYTTIALAMGAARPGDVIAIGAGTYDERVVVRAGVTLWGSSVADVEITYSGPLDVMRAVVSAGGAGVVVENLRVTGNLNGLDAVGPSRSMRIESVVVDATEGVGVYTGDAATLDAEDLVLRDIRSLSALSRLGRAISAENGSTVTLRRAVALRCRAEAFFVSVGAHATFEDIAAIDTQMRSSDLTRGFGMFVAEADATVTRAAFVRSGEQGIRVGNAGTSFTASDIVITTVSGRVLDNRGAGVVVDSGGAATLSRALIQDVPSNGAFVDGTGTSCSLDDVVIRDVRSLPTPGEMSGGRAVMVQQGADATLRRVLVERADNYAFWVGAATATAEDLVGLDVQASDAEPTIGTGLASVLDASVTLTRGRFERLASVGIGASMGGSLDVSDVVLRDVSGAAVIAQAGAHVELDRAVVERTSGVGLDSVFEGSVLAARDVAVRDVDPTPDGLYGAAAVCARNSVLDVTRMVAERAHEVGFGVSEGATLRAVDLVVRGTRPRLSDGYAGHGVHVQMAATAELSRVLLEGNHNAGLYAISSGTMVTATDLAVLDTGGARYEGIDGLFGEGMVVVAGARADVEQALFLRNHEVGVTAQLPGSVLDMRRVVMAETLERECVELGTCSSGAGAGTGLLVRNGARTTVTDFEIRDNALVGLQLVGDLDADLSDGEIRNNTIGANVQSPGFDLARITEGVEYRDNAVNLDSTELPVPEAPTLMTGS